MALGRREETSDSLELLLDTICNVFGGIILMAILVVLQTQTSAGRLPDPRPEDVQRGLEARRLRFECDRLRTRLEDLKLHREEVDQTFRLTTSPSGERLANTAQVFQKAIEDARRRLASDERETTDAGRTRIEAETLLRDAERLAKDKQDELARLTDELQRPSSALPQGIRLPHRRGSATGIPRYYVVKGSKAYAFGEGRLPRWQGSPYTLEDCLVTPCADAVGPAIRAEVRPLKDAGFPVPGDGTAQSGLLNSLRSCTAQTHYLVFFVYRDSE